MGALNVKKAHAPYAALSAESLLLVYVPAARANARSRHAHQRKSFAAQPQIQQIPYFLLFKRSFNCFAHLSANCNSPDNCVLNASS